MPKAEGGNGFMALLATAAKKEAAFDVWPENWAAFLLFESIRTQWWVGPAGATGLNYLVLYAKLDSLGLTGEEREHMEADIRELEAGALEAMHEKD